MFISDSYGINSAGHLTVGGADCIELAEKYGTPLYVMDESYIRKACREYRDIMNYYFGADSIVAYASKAFCAVGIYEILNQENISADVVSSGEIYTALAAGFPAERLILHGNNKTENDIAFALDNGVGRIVVDNFDELNLLNSIACSKGKIANILFRIKPGIEAHTHEFIKTGQIDSKFGVALETGEALQFVKAALKLDNIKLNGIHCHIGSQIFDAAPFALAARRMMEFIAVVRNQLGYELAELNLGGGFGIKYTEKDNPLPINSYLQAVSDEITECVDKYGLSRPKIMIEPGRSVVAPSGLTVYKVGAVKNIPGIRNYVSIDGGMTDNPRYALYQSEYEILSAERPMDKKSMVCTIAGRNCESGDLIAKDIELQPVSAGDCIAVLATGAYNYSMASNYNRVARPAVVMVSDGKDRLIVKRESFNDLIRNDVKL